MHGVRQGRVFGEGQRFLVPGAEDDVCFGENVAIGLGRKVRRGQFDGLGLRFIDALILALDQSGVRGGVDGDLQADGLGGQVRDVHRITAEIKEGRDHHQRPDRGVAIGRSREFLCKMRHVIFPGCH